MPDAFGSLRTIREKDFSLHFIFADGFGSRFLLALRTLSDVSKCRGGLVEFGLALVGDLPAGLLRSDEGVGGVVFMGEQQRGLDFHFAFEEMLVFEGGVLIVVIVVGIPACV